MRASHSRIAAWLASLCLLVQGCATPQGMAITQTVRVETPGCAQVTCELSNDRGTWSLVRTPGTVEVTTSHAPLKVSCRADEGGLGSGGALSSLPPSTGTGAIAGGAVGGAAIAAAAGASLFWVPPLSVIMIVSGVAAGATAGQAVEARQRSIQYPEIINVPMTCAVAMPPRPAGAPLGLAIRGMDAAEALSAGLHGRGAVLVMTVAPGGSAEIAGLRSGDIVLAVGGRDVNDATELEERLLTLAPGESTSVQVRRDGQLLALALVRRAESP